MADEKENKPTTATVKPLPAEAGAEDEHYEIVSEYRIGEGPPPIFLVVCFVLIVLWAMFSWIPFFGY
jgi:hypothetical protein